MPAQYVYGKNSVKAVMDTRPNQVYKIFLSDSLKPDKRINAIIEQANANRISIQKVPRNRLDQMLREMVSSDEDLGELNHQGVIASVAPKPFLTIHQLLEKCKAKQSEGAYARVLMLDGVTDPRNLGAILRVADAAGVDGVVLPKHHSAGFGPAVSKTASGAEESVPVAIVSNLAQALDLLKEANLWAVGAANAASAVDYTKQDYKMSTVLVMGSEGAGLSALIQKKCDFLVKIPMHGMVDSLNVATATAVLLFEIIRP